VRHRKFTPWIDKNAPDWQPDGIVVNRFPYDANRPNETSHSDFYFFARQPR
jgi:hypothetical protein